MVYNGVKGGATMVLILLLAILGWHNEVWGPLLREISWPFWVVFSLLAVGDFLLIGVFKNT